MGQTRTVMRPIKWAGGRTSVLCPCSALSLFRSPALPLLLSLLLPPAAAQSVVDHYHEAAGLFVAGDDRAAEAAAVAGLRLDPDDAKLLELLEAIRERNPEQGGEGEPEESDDADEQQGGGQQQQSDSQAGGDQQQDGASEGNAEDEPSDAGEAGDEPQDQPSDEDQEAERDGAGSGQGEPQDGEPGTGAVAGAEGEMSRAEAERILRAIQADELELLREVQRRRSRGRYVEKDW